MSLLGWFMAIMHEKIRGFHMALHKGQNQNLEVVWIVWTLLVLLLDSKKIWIPLSYHDKALGGDFMAYPLWIGMEIKLHQLAISPGGSPADWRLVLQIVVQLHSIWPIECAGEINQGVGSLLLHLHIWGLLLPSIIANLACWWWGDWGRAHLSSFCLPESVGMVSIERESLYFSHLS